MARRRQMSSLDAEEWLFPPPNPVVLLAAKLKKIPGHIPRKKGKRRR